MLYQKYFKSSSIRVTVWLQIVLKVVTLKLNLKGIFKK